MVVSGGPAAVQAAEASPPLVLQLKGHSPVEARVVSQHKWLGLPWRGDLDMAALRGQRLGAASSQVASLAGLVARRDLPLAAAEAIFEAQTEGGLRFGRWLWAVDETSGAAHDASRERWAQLLLGLPPWRGQQVAVGELGWVRSGAGTAAVEVTSCPACVFVGPS